MIFDEDLQDDTQADGDDIAFADDTDWLDHEVMAWDQNYNASDAFLAVWVKISTLDYDDDTIIYMYYGNATMTDRQDVIGTWAEWEAVYHLQEAVYDGTSGEAVDSTGNHNMTGGYGNKNPPDAGTAIDPYDIINGDSPLTSVNFDGQGDSGNSGDILITNDDMPLDWSEITQWCMLWIDNAYDARVWGNSFGTASNAQGLLQRANAGGMGARVRTDTSVNTGWDTGLSNQNEWMFQTLSWDTTSDSIIRYQGTDSGWETPQSIGLSGNEIFDGVHRRFGAGNLAMPTDVRGLDGKIAELRVANKIFSADYSQSAYKNIMNNTNWFSISLEGEVGGMNYELDLEVGWTSVDFDETQEWLKIYCGSQNTEALKVDIWTGSWTNIIVDLSTGWNNVSISSYLDDATVEIRFVDNDKISDIDQGTWEIDTVMLHTWTAEVDSDPPTWDTLIESADPLELGLNETIHINVYDDSIISDVYLEYGGNNYSMNFEFGDTYNYTNWLPTSIGVKTYQIHIIDEYSNINQTSDLTIIVVDTINPTISNIIESADPLELGNTEIIHVDITDESTIIWVYLEFESVNYSMVLDSGITWNYTTWTPSSIGVYPYTIWANDSEGNINSDSSGSITVQDSVNPVISNIIESADPLELGNTEIIHVDITDDSPITWVYLEFEGVNYSMVLDSGITWNYTTWTPSSIGLYPYTIWANDSEGNINSDSSGSITVQDSVNPVISNIIESADPLELGNTEIIHVDITDDSPITWVYLEFEGVNYSMVLDSGITWNYTMWIPSSVGVYSYTIWANDTFGNINSDSSGSITVQDTITPLWFDLIESDDPLELGNNETITINITDVSGINLVYLEYDGNNYTMNNIYGNTYQWSNWFPSTVGVKNYEIFIQDNNGLWNTTSGSITVQDTITPLWFDLIESDDPLELGNNETITVNITDISGINLVYLEYDGNNYTMNNIYGNTYQWSNWLPSIVGVKNYKIFIQDNNGLWNTTSGSITVQDTTAPVIFNVIESDDPLTIGDNETILCNVSDLSSLYFVYLEFESSNNSMWIQIGITYNYSNWLPDSTGLFDYTIWVNDTSGNVNSYDGTILVIEIGVDVFAPTWNNLIFETNPLELGNLFTVWINVYDNTNVSSVVIEIGGNNYNMINLYNNTWVYFNYLFEETGSYDYSIKMLDSFSNLNFTQGIIQVVSSPMITMSIAIIFLLMGMMIYFYLKGERSMNLFLITLIINSFSTIIGFLAMFILGFPFTPYLQSFFILIQSILFMLITLEIFSKKELK